MNAPPHEAPPRPEPSPLQLDAMAPGVTGAPDSAVTVGSRGASEAASQLALVPERGVAVVGTAMPRSPMPVFLKQGLFY